MQHYEEELKQRIVHLHLKEGRTLKSLSEEYGASKACNSISHPLPAERLRPRLFPEAVC